MKLLFKALIVGQGISLLGLVIGLTAPTGFALTPAALRPVTDLPSNLGLDDQLCLRSPSVGTSRKPVVNSRQATITAIDHSLRYLKTAKAQADYRSYPIKTITRLRVQRSLERFRYLVLTCRSAADLRSRVRREFAFYQSVGKDGQGTVAFTGYFEPVQTASRVPTAVYRYPIYRLPTDFVGWQKPHPSRLQLEGHDGLQGDKGKLRGAELVWLSDRLEAFLIQVQGSARLRLTDGQTLTVGYAAHTDYPYTGIGRELVKDGKMKLEDLTLSTLRQHFRKHPTDLDIYLPRNQRFVFFRETGGAPATGSLNVPVTAERSIATDKSLFPPGALAWIQTQVADSNVARAAKQPLIRHYVLDQDTGGAIKGAGRVDIFMGTGEKAGDRAGLINATGQLYYLLLK